VDFSPPSEEAKSEKSEDRDREANPHTRRLAEIHERAGKLSSSPWSHDVLELVMAESLPMAEHEECFPWLMIVGVPSSDKTATVQLIKDAPGVQYVDTMTEHALASGYVPKGKQQKKRDLLTQMEEGKKTTLAIRDLTTIFSLREDTVKKFLGELNSIYEGVFVKATGTAGVMTYSTRFTIIACITSNALAQHHKYMSQIGPRFMFYRLPNLTETEKEAGFELLNHLDRNSTKATLRRLVMGHVQKIAALPFEGETKDQQNQLALLGDLLGRGRAAVRWARVEGTWEIDGVQIEEPFRAFQQLSNLGRRLAKVHGRTRLTDHELEMLRRVALASAQGHRADVLALFQTGTDFTVEECADALGKSDDRTRQVLKELQRVGLVVVTPGAGSKAATYAPNPRFAKLITRPLKPLNHIEDLYR
jgi:hypothetical protein